MRQIRHQQVCHAAGNIGGGVARQPVAAGGSALAVPDDPLDSVLQRLSTEFCFGGKDGRSAIGFNSNLSQLNKVQLKFGPTTNLYRPGLSSPAQLPVLGSLEMGRFSSLAQSIIYSFAFFFPSNHETWQIQVSPLSNLSTRTV